MREEIENYLAENGIKQNWLAEKVGISKQRLNMYLKNRRELPDPILEKLTKIIEK